MILNHTVYKPYCSTQIYPAATLDMTFPPVEVTSRPVIEYSWTGAMSSGVRRVTSHTHLLVCLGGGLSFEDDAPAWTQAIRTGSLKLRETRERE